MGFKMNTKDEIRIDKLLKMIATRINFIQGYCIQEGTYGNKLKEIVILIKEQTDRMDISNIVTHLDTIFNNKYKFVYLHIKRKNDRLIAEHCKASIVWFKK